MNKGRPVIETLAKTFIDEPPIPDPELGMPVTDRSRLHPARLWFKVFLFFINQMGIGILSPEPVRCHEWTKGDVQHKPGRNDIRDNVLDVGKIEASFRSLYFAPGEPEAHVFRPYLPEGVQALAERCEAVFNEEVPNAS